MGKQIKLIGLCLILLPATVFFFQLTELSATIDTKLLLPLINIDDVPPEKTFDAVYILGGSQESLKAKYKKFASLYAQGCCKEVSILSRPGITEYNNSLKRNMTNDEWSLMFLEKCGVPKNSVRPLTIEPGFFGTYSEAKEFSKIVIKKDWSSLLLITSPHHTKRTKKSFEYFFKDKMVEVFVVASQNQVGLFEILFEHLKIKVYELFLLT